MKQAKQRVIAIDYFRGVLIIAVLLNHALLFTRPYNYLAGNGVLWTTAAELFLVLSGLTLWLVRGKDFIESPLMTSKRILRRSAITYLIYMTVAFISYAMAMFFVSHRMTNDVLGVPQTFSSAFVLKMLSLQYSFGWASFLLYFSVFLAVSPLALAFLKSRFWILLPLASITIFLLKASPANPQGIYGSLAIWQIYYVTGMTIGRFWNELNAGYKRLLILTNGWLARIIVIFTGVLLAISIALEYSIFPFVNRLTVAGWLPLKFDHAYAKLLQHKTQIDFWLVNGRYGALRPLFALLLLISAFILYQRYKLVLQQKTGQFLNVMGRHSLNIFIAQAIAIPCLALIPLPRNIVTNAWLTSTLIFLMWAVTQKQRLGIEISIYLEGLRTSFYESKHAYLQQYGDIQESS